MNARDERLRQSMRIFRRLQRLYGEDPTWLPAEPESKDMGSLQLRREVLETLLDELPVWELVQAEEAGQATGQEGLGNGSGDLAIDRSMQLESREEGLVVLLFLSHALGGSDDPIRFRTIWEEHRLTIRLWAAGGGVTDGVLALASSLDATLFPLQTPAEVGHPLSDGFGPELSS